MDSPRRPSSAESVTQLETHEKPWKYIGYKVFSRWVASDPSFFILRRFGALNVRVALSLQDEIVQLEEKLDYMDKRYSDRDIPDVHNGTFRDEAFTGDDDRQALVKDVLPEKLTKYSMCLYDFCKDFKETLTLIYRLIPEWLFATRFSWTLSSRRYR